MLNHILVPLDGSELAEKALQYARNIVQPTGKLTLLSVVDVPDLNFFAYADIPVAVKVNEYRESVDQYSRQLTDYLANLKKTSEIGDLAIDFLVREGDPATAIIEEARDLEVDAIVMSTHGRTGIDRWLMGSVTNKVLNATPCPVFVIPNRS